MGKDNLLKTADFVKMLPQGKQIFNKWKIFKLTGVHFKV
jgi:hypothetical protein